MRNTFLLFILVFSLVIFCSKEDTSTGPDPTPPDEEPTTTTAFQLIKHDIIAELPSSVVSLFQVTNMENKGIDFLTTDRFQVFEEGNLVDQTASAMYMLKKTDINYTGKTYLIIENNVGTDLDALKKGALEIIRRADPKQKFLVYTVSDQLQQLEQIPDATNDSNALTAAINSIGEGGESVNLYGAVMEVNREEKEEYTLGNVRQNFVVVLTDSPDDVGAYPIEVVSVANRQRKVYTIGYGGVDATDLEQIGIKSYFSAGDETKIVEQAVKVQMEIIKYMNSFYRLSYQSAQRGGSGHSIEIKVSGNTNTETSAMIEGTFPSSGFVDVETGLYVNWSYSNPQGVDLVMVMVNDERTVEVISMGGSKLPSLSFSVEKPNVISVSGGSGGRVTISATGAVGDSTNLTIRDNANGFSKDLMVKVVSFQMGKVLYEIWEDVTGTSVNNLTSDARYPSSPTTVSELESWEIPTDKDDNYGTRIRGYLHPPQTGKYTFWIASDDASDLLLSTDDSPDNAVRVCYVSSWTNSREWGKETNQKSAEIELQAGKHYYMETLHNEGTGGDNLAVAWAIEGGTREVIGGDYLSLYLGD